MRPDKKKEHKKEYLEDVTAKILEHKWLESEKAGRDLGQDACIDWIKKFAKTHRREFVEKHLEKAEAINEEAEQALEKLNENPNIPQEIKDALSAICRKLIESCEEIDKSKDNVDVNDVQK